MSQENEYYLLHLGPINDGYADHYQFDLTKAFFGTEKQCTLSFFSDMKGIYTGDWQLFCPLSETEIELSDIKISLLLLKDKVLETKITSKKKNPEDLSLKLLHYSTNGGLHSGFGALLLPKGQILKVSAIL